MYLERQSLETAWGDVRTGLWMAVTRAGLLRLREGHDAKNWRPHLLVLSGAPHTRWPLVQLAAAITHNRSILTVSTVITTPDVAPPRLAAMERQIHDFLAERAVQALVRVIAAPDPFAGAERLVDSYGLGAFVPNTIVLGDTKSPERQVRYGESVRHFYESRRNVIIVRDSGAEGYGQRRRIDVWWGGMKGNGGLMLLLAYLIHTSLEWRGSELRIQMVAPNEAAAAEMRATVGELLRQTRTGAALHIILAQGRTFDQVLRETSHGADLILLGLARPDADDFAAYYTALRTRTAGLPTTLFVLASEEIAFGQVLQ